MKSTRRRIVNPWGGEWSQATNADPDEPMPFCYARLYGEEKYRLQNMLLKSVNCPPARRFKGEATSVWDDRLYTEWRAALPVIQSNQTGDAYFAGATDASFMAFARLIATAISFGEITGARIIRYTNVASGYPTLRLDLVRAEV